jgi:hypothetical protein
VARRVTPWTSRTCHTCHSVTLGPLTCGNGSDREVTPNGAKCLPLSLYVTSATTAGTRGE